MHFANRPATVESDVLERDEENLDELKEYVIDHIVSHRRDSDGVMLLRIRWFGFDKSEDTWERALHIPVELTRRYVRKRKLDLNDFSSQPLPVPDARTGDDLRGANVRFTICTLRMMSLLYW
jgi:hypothetical protein